MAAVSAMSAAERDKMLSQIDERLFSILPESTLEQAAITAVQKEYTALGIDLSAMQSRSIWSNGGMMLLIALIGAGAAVAVGYFGSVTAARLGRDLRGEIFHKVIHFGQQEMDGFSTASLITRSTNDIQQVQNVMVMLLRVVIYAPIIGVGRRAARAANQRLDGVDYLCGRACGRGRRDGAVHAGHARALNACRRRWTRSTA